MAFTPPTKDENGWWTSKLKRKHQFYIHTAEKTPDLTKPVKVRVLTGLADEAAPDNLVAEKDYYEFTVDFSALTAISSLTADYIQSLPSGDERYIHYLWIESQVSLGGENGATCSSFSFKDGLDPRANGWETWPRLPLVSEGKSFAYVGYIYKQSPGTSITIFQNFISDIEAFSPVIHISNQTGSPGPTDMTKEEYQVNNPDLYQSGIPDTEIAVVPKSRRLVLFRHKEMRTDLLDGVQVSDPV